MKSQNCSVWNNVESYSNFTYKSTVTSAKRHGGTFPKPGGFCHSLNRQQQLRVTHQMRVSAPSGIALYGSHHCVDFTLHDVNVLIHHPDNPENKGNSSQSPAPHNHSLPPTKHQVGPSEAGGLQRCKKLLQIFVLCMQTVILSKGRQKEDTFPQSVFSRRREQTVSYNTASAKQETTLPRRIPLFFSGLWEFTERSSVRVPGQTSMIMQ